MHRNNNVCYVQHSVKRQKEVMMKLLMLMMLQERTGTPVYLCQPVFDLYQWQ